jgi:luciferase-type oxidoreductase
MQANTNSTPLLTGASSETFTYHPGYRRMFAPDALTLGIFLPLRFYAGDMSVLTGQTRLIKQIDQHGFASIWVRDVPLFDPYFGDAGQLFDPFTYLAFLAGQTQHVSLATGSAIFSLRHPIDLAKAATTIDQLSGGRLILGIASGDRPVEFPAYGLSHQERGTRFAEAVSVFRQLMQHGDLTIRSELGDIQGVECLPKPVNGSIPLIVTGSSRQTMPWIGEHADGWLTFPEATHNTEGVRRLAEKIRTWRSHIPDNGFRPHMTNEWIDLVDNPDYPPTPLRGGFVLQTGRKGLIRLLSQWQDAGVNHAALGMQFSERPVQDIIQELAEEVLPLFPSHPSPQADTQQW